VKKYIDRKFGLLPWDNIPFLSFSAVGIFVLLLTAGSMAYAADSSSKASVVAGMIKTMRGNVTIERNNSKVVAKTGTAIMVRDKLSTGNASSVGVTLKDDTLLSLGSNSTLIINSFGFNHTTHDGDVNVRINHGTLSVVSGKISKQSPDSVKYSTPTTVFGVRGTEFIIHVKGKDG